MYLLRHVTDMSVVGRTAQLLMYAAVSWTRVTLQMCMTLSHCFCHYGPSGGVREQTVEALLVLHLAGPSDPPCRPPLATSSGCPVLQKDPVQSWPHCRSLQVQSPHLLEHNLSPFVRPGFIPDYTPTHDPHQLSILPTSARHE